MQAIYVDKNIPRVLLTKAISPLWPGFVWTPLSAARAGLVPDMPLPGPHWLRLQNERCGICASDLSLLFVHADPSVAPAALPGLSRFWLGHEVVSVVTEVGAGVTRFKVGDRVMMDTYFAGSNCLTLGIEPPCRYCLEQEYHFCINKSEAGPHGAGGGFGDSYVAHETDVYPVASGLTLDQAALVEPISIGVHGVLRTPPPPDGKVLVYGAGIIGLTLMMALQLFYPDVQVTAVARYPFQAQMAEKYGAKHVLNGREGYETIARLAGGKYFSGPLNKGLVVGGYDVVYDCVGSSATLTDSLRWTRAGGSVQMVGLHFTPMPKIDLTPVWYHHVNLVGTYGHGFSFYQGQRQHDYEWIMDAYQAGKLDIDGLITHRFPLKDYKEAIRVAMAKGREKAIKVMFEHEA